ncbi:MAG: hypothetical protein LBF44_03460 [Holosporaceae bacterium]|nr:hypothetical protein [Holosporaceae bacterium]
MRKIAALLVFFMICIHSKCMESMSTLHVSSISKEFRCSIYSTCAEAAREMWSINVSNVESQISKILALLDSLKDRVRGQNLQQFYWENFSKTLEQAMISVFYLGLIHTPFNEEKLDKHDFFDSLFSSDDDSILPFDAEWFAKAFQKVDDDLHNVANAIGHLSLERDVNWLDCCRAFASRSSVQNDPPATRQLFVNTNQQDNPMDRIILIRAEHHLINEDNFYDTIIKTQRAKLLYRRTRDESKRKERQIRVRKSYNKKIRRIEKFWMEYE